MPLPQRSSFPAAATAPAAAPTLALVGPPTDAERALRARYARATSATVRAQLPWAVATFLVTYAAVAIFELQLHPARTATYVWVYLAGLAWCLVAVGLTRGAAVSPTRCLVVTIVTGVALILNTTVYHALVGGEAEVLALGNLYLMIGFLAAFPWGGWAQLVVSSAACAGLAIGLVTTTVHAAVSSGVLMSGMVSLGGLAIASAVLTDRYRYSLFVAQEELQIAKDAAEAASHARRDFVASVSHDLRTPVNIIFGMAEMALDAAVDPAQRDLIATIKRSASQLGALLNDLLDFSKMDAGKVDLAPRRFAVRPWLEAAVVAHAPDAAAKRLQLAAVIDPAVPDTARADPDRLRQVVDNLIGNAVKFTERGGVTVRLIGGADAGTLRCEVADTGIGVDPAESTHLFQPFAQAPAISRSHGGTGLGLAICKRLVEQMGGTIGLESTPKRGSTFWFTVPVR